MKKQFALLGLVAAVTLALGVTWFASAAATLPLSLGTAVQTIPVGAHPKGIAATSDRVYVALNDTPQVVVIDPATDRVTATWLTGAQGGPHFGNGVAVCGGKLFVANRDLKSVSILDRFTGAQHRQIPVGKLPFGLDASATAGGTGRVYVANFGDDTVSVIDCQSERVVATTAGGHEPALVAADAGVGFVAYHNSGGAAGLRVYDSAGVMSRNLSTGNGAFGVAVNPRPEIRRLWVGNMDGKQLSIMNLDTLGVLLTAALPFKPHALASPQINPGVPGPGRVHVWTVDTDQNKAVCLDGDDGKVLFQVGVGAQNPAEGGQGLAIAPFLNPLTGRPDHKVYVSNYDAGTVSAFVERCVDLGIAKNDDPDPVKAGAILHYTLNVSNPGLEPLHKVVVTDSYDAKTDLSGAPNCPGTVAEGRPLIWQVGDLAPLSNLLCKFDVKVQDDVAAGTRLLNQVRAEGLDHHERPMIASATTSTLVERDTTPTGWGITGISFDDPVGIGFIVPTTPRESGLRVELLDKDGKPVKDANGYPITTTTAADGTYSFTGLASGKYKVKFVIPPGYGVTQKDAGTDDDLDSDANVDGLTDVITIGPDQALHKWSVGKRKFVLTGVSCTFTPSSGQIEMNVTVADRALDQKIFDLEVIYPWQSPAWTHADAAQLPLYWSSEGMSNGLRLLTSFNPLVLSKLTTFKLNYTAPAVPEGIYLHATDSNGKNMGAVYCPRLCPYKPCPPCP